MPAKLIYAAVTNPSFVLGSQDLAELAEVAVAAQQVERLAKSLGQERGDERDRAAAAYLALPLVERKEAPVGVTPPDRGVVGTDGGRLQIFDRAASAPTGATTPVEPVLTDDDPKRRGRHWREDKVGLLMAMKSAVSASDPCPDVPEGFLDPTRMGTLVRELRKGVPLVEEPAGQ